MYNTSSNHVYTRDPRIVQSANDRSYASPIHKAWIWFNQNMFEFINVPVPSNQFYFDPFLFLEILKPIANLNFLFLFFSDLIKIILK